MSDDLILEVKPKFVWYVRTFSLNILIAFVFIQGLVLVYVLLMLKGIFYLYLTIFLYFLVLFMLVFLNKKNYEVCSFKVYKDRVEIKEGFIMHKHSVMKLVDIKEVHMGQTFFQRMAGVGNIRFLSAGSTNYQYTGLRFLDIENPEEVYKEIKKLFEKI